MAKNATKRAPKAPTKTPTTASKSTDPPAPYTTPSPVLLSLLSTLDPSHIYITHIDAHPRDLKKRIFVVPILMNIVFALLLLWRARIALPSYFGILAATLGFDNGVNVDIANTDWPVLLDITIRRAMMFFFDFALVTFVVPWPVDFFLGKPASPCLWRWRVGFRNQEIVVRRSRRWDRKLEKGWLAEEGADGVVHKERIVPAIDREWVKTKTGYLMMDKSWDLDFAGMLTAHEMVEQGKATLEDFQKAVFVHTEDFGWLVWSVWKLDEGAQEEGRQKVVLFKDKLTAMGKENLFFQWIELIQFETSQPGGFTVERQEIAMKRARELFEAQGVDFDKFWKEVGGVQGLPGMDNISA